MTCINARDTISQELGEAIANHKDYDDSNHVVTSFCRVEGGTWIGWYNQITGDGIDAYGTDAYGDDTNKADWPSLIASATPIGVGYFPDDGSPSTVYELGLDAVYFWNTVGGLSPSDPCSLFPFIGDHYADTGKAQLTGWGMNPLDVQVRTDGVNVWIVVLACESVQYPYLWNNPAERDDCDRKDPDFVDEWAAGHSSPFFHDSDAGNRWWLYGPGQIFNTQPFGPYDDPGWSNSFRWQPARVTVWGGDLGGFTVLGTIEAQFDNFNGLCSHAECTASEEEPGVLHVLWAEGGNADRKPDPVCGQRINYSRWDASSQTLGTDIYTALEAGSGTVSDEAFIWTGEMILRNEHGSPAAIVWPWVCAGGPQYVSSAAQYWDLTDGTPDILQTADASLEPTPAECGVSNSNELYGVDIGSDMGAGGGVGFVTLRRSQFASSLYVDPTLGNTPVYLLCVRASLSAGPQPTIASFLRIPCDGSADFSYMDGIRLPGYSIIPAQDVGLGEMFASRFHADFVSDPDNVWMPTDSNAGGHVLHLDRQCAKLWEELVAFPIPDPVFSGYELGAWSAYINSLNPLEIVTDDGGDWLWGAGQELPVDYPTNFPAHVSALRAKICRCCVPCNKLNLHIWQRF